jgi:hypothetical protein
LLEALCEVRRDHYYCTVPKVFTLGPQSFDGIRRRALPLLYKALEPGTDDDRMKGALWTLNNPFFGIFVSPFVSKIMVNGIPVS